MLIITVMKASKSPDAGVKQVTSPSDVTRVSIAEARRIMGKASDVMSDETVQKAIYDLTAIARAYIQSVPK